MEENRATPHDICKESPVQLVPWCLRMAGFIFVNDGKDAWHYLFMFLFLIQKGHIIFVYFHVSLVLIPSCLPFCFTLK